jgi:hypothetical protein
MTNTELVAKIAKDAELTQIQAQKATIMAMTQI